MAPGASSREVGIEPRIEPRVALALVCGEALRRSLRDRVAQLRESLLPLGQIEQPLEMRRQWLAVLSGVRLQPVPGCGRHLDGRRGHTLSIPMAGGRRVDGE